MNNYSDARVACLANLVNVEEVKIAARKEAEAKVRKAIEKKREGDVEDGGEEE
jgi:hypothetical protein